MVGRAALSGDKGINAVLDGVRVKGTVALSKNELSIWIYGATHQLRLITEMPPASTLGGSVGPVGNLVSPMPGRVVRLGPKVGESVARGTVLLVIEAMKMEHSIVALANGKVEKFRAKPGDWVEEAALLVDFNTDS